METLIPLITQMITGAIGGNAAGKAMKSISLGKLGNTIIGLIGGGLGGQIMAMLGLGVGMEADGAMEMSGVLTEAGGGAAGGGGLLAIVAQVKAALGMGKPVAEPEANEETKAE